MGVWVYELHTRDTGQSQAKGDKLWGCGFTNSTPPGVTDYIPQTTGNTENLALVIARDCETPPNTRVG